MKLSGCQGGKKWSVESGKNFFGNGRNLCPVFDRFCDIASGRSVGALRACITEETVMIDEIPKELAVLHEASRALAQAETVEEVKKLRDMAESARGFAAERGNWVGEAK
jgi:hypothetical protein